MRRRIGEWSLALSVLVTATSFGDEPASTARSRFVSLFRRPAAKAETPPALNPTAAATPAAPLSASALPVTATSQAVAPVAATPQAVAPVAPASPNVALASATAPIVTSSETETITAAPYMTEEATTSSWMQSTPVSMMQSCTPTYGPACGPRWWGTVENVWLRPNETQSLSLVQQVQADSNGALSRADVPATVAEQTISAPRITLGFAPTSGHAAEFTGFWMGGPNQTNTDVVQGQNVDFPFFVDANNPIPLARGFLTGLPAGFPTIADQFTTDWSLNVWSISGSWLKTYDRPDRVLEHFAFGLGLRYLHISEDVTANFINNPSAQTGSLDVETTNNVIGPEFLSRGTFKVIPRWVAASAELRAGLNGNAVSDRKTILVNGTSTASGSTESVVFSPSVEGNFMLDFRPMRHVSIFTGYQVLYVANVDRAVEQLDPNLGSFVSGASNQGQLFLHGPRLGLRVTY